MRAGVDTVKTECAVHVACLLRLEKLQLAAPLDLVAAQTVVRCARATNINAAHPDFDWRDERLNKLILSNGTHVLAETCAFEETINN